MPQNLITKASTQKSKNKNVGLIILFILVAVIGLFYVKWSPYYTKAFLAASKHSIGNSIITGKSGTAPAPSLATAVAYMAAYFKSVWKAVILGLLLGSLIQVSIPENWIRKALGSKSLKSTAIAGAASLPGMMCSCCAAPVAVGLRKRSASINSALAFFLGNPTLNPATIIFMGFVLGWNFALFRIIMGLILVFGISTIAGRFFDDKSIYDESIILKDEAEQNESSLLIRWLKALWQLIVDTIPAYIIVVALLGALRAWLFPAISLDLGNKIPIIILFAITGTLFVIPTAAEIPIIQTLMAFGLGAGPVAALLIALPATSLPALLIAKRAFSKKVLAFVAASVAVLGIISGLIGMVIF